LPTCPEASFYPTLRNVLVSICSQQQLVDVPRWDGRRMLIKVGVKNYPFFSIPPSFACPLPTPTPSLVLHLCLSPKTSHYPLSPVAFTWRFGVSSPDIFEDSLGLCEL